MLMFVTHVVLGSREVIEKAVTGPEPVLVPFLLWESGEKAFYLNSNPERTLTLSEVRQREDNGTLFPITPPKHIDPEQQALYLEDEQLWVYEIGNFDKAKGIFCGVLHYH